MLESVSTNAEHLQIRKMLAKRQCQAAVTRAARFAALAILNLIGFGLLMSPNVIAQNGEPPRNPKEKEPVDGQIRGVLQFKSRRADFDGGFIGEQAPKNYRYIIGHPDSPQRAIWNFEKLPRNMLAPPGDVIPVRFTCLFFNLIKLDGPGADVEIRAVSHTCPQVPPDTQQKGGWEWARKEVDVKGKTRKDCYVEELAAYRAKMIDPTAPKPNAEDWKAANDLAEKYGYYDVRLPKVFEEKEVSFNLPAGLFRNAMKNDREVDAAGKPKRPLVSVIVKCETKGLMIGMIESGLYLLEKPPVKK